MASPPFDRVPLEELRSGDRVVLLAGDEAVSDVLQVVAVSDAGAYVRYAVEGVEHPRIRKDNPVTLNEGPFGRLHG